MQRQRIATLADIEGIEARPYDRFMAHGSVHDALADAAGRHADRPALRFIADADAPGLTQCWSHREFLAEVRRAARLFRSLAGEAGADTLPRVALLLPAIPQAYFALWGAEAAGVACPLNYLLDLDHLAELIDRAGANLLVALGPHPELDIWPRALALRLRRGCSGACRCGGRGDLWCIEPDRGHITTISALSAPACRGRWGSTMVRRAFFVRAPACPSTMRPCAKTKNIGTD